MNRSKTDCTSAGSEAVTARVYAEVRVSIVVAGLAREHDPGGLPGDDHTRLDGPHLPAASVRDQRVRGLEARQLLEMLDRREDEQQLAGAGGRQRCGRLIPAGVDDLAAIDGRTCPGRQL